MSSTVVIVAIYALVLVAVLAGAATVAAVLAVVQLRRRRNWLDRASTREVIVHTSDDQSFQGVVRETCEDGIVLAAARLLEQDLALAGDVFVPRSKILMVQAPQ